MFTNQTINKSIRTTCDPINALHQLIHSTPTILIGAGSGLSSAAGYRYSGARMQYYFQDFIEKYHFENMYEGGFYPFDTLEEYWAYWSRYVYINRYQDCENDVYQDLYELVKTKDYFVLTTNVDHCFQRYGFDHDRLFYTQGDYGLFQCSTPCHEMTYDNESIIKAMILAQGFTIDQDHRLVKPSTPLKMTVPSKLIPYCPHCGKPMRTNLREDDRFVQDQGWHDALNRYNGFIHTHRHQPVLYLELGVGYNTPSIVKFSFWRMVAQNNKAIYACINQDECYAPKEIIKRSICIEADIAEVVSTLK